LKLIPNGRRTWGSASWYLVFGIRNLGASGRPLKRMMSLYKYPGTGQLEGHKSYGPNTNFMTHPQTISFAFRRHHLLLLFFFCFISPFEKCQGKQAARWELVTGSLDAGRFQEKVLREKRVAKTLCLPPLHLKLNPSQGKHEFIIKSKLKVNKTRRTHEQQEQPDQSRTHEPQKPYPRKQANWFGFV